MARRLAGFASRPAIAGRPITVRAATELVFADWTPKRQKTHRPQIRRFLDGAPAAAESGTEIEGFAKRRLDTVQGADLNRHVHQVRVHVGTVKVNQALSTGGSLWSYDVDSHGYGAANHSVDLLRALFTDIERRGLRRNNPAADVRHLRYPPFPRRALTDEEYEQVYASGWLTSRDPRLDIAVMSLLNRTGARREGLLNLRLQHLFADRPSVLLDEKGKAREIPYHRAGLLELYELAVGRGAEQPSDQVFRLVGGKPMTRRHLDGLWLRVRDQLPWAKALGVSSHWLRHTVLTRVDEVAGQKMAAWWGGHAPPQPVTARYTRAESFEEMAEVSTALYGALFD
jgi:site-specific recombinase XerD